jgi:hypothetical protein
MNDSIEDVDKALLSAMTPKVLKSDGLELKPYNYVRQQAAVMMGLRWRPQARMHDAAVDVWLCTLEDRAVLDITENDDTLAQAKLDAFAWADARGYTLLDCDELMEIHNKITKEIVDSTRARIKQQNGNGNGNGDHAAEAVEVEDEKNAGGPRASSKKARRSRP